MRNDESSRDGTRTDYDSSLVALEDTRTITLHSTGLAIQDVLFKVPSDGTCYAIVPSMDEAKQQMTVTLPSNPASAGTNAQLTIKFNGELKRALLGLFRTPYIHPEDGSKRWMVASQLQPTQARSVFPCFDEPALKATFQITLVADRNLTCLSNMPESHSHHVGSDRRSTTFQVSPQMSTYLVAFAVGDFNMISTGLFRKPLCFYSTPNIDVETGRFGLELAAKTLAFFEDKFGLPFPLPKMDLIAITDFIGAMENWGLVTFRESDIVFDPQTKSIPQQRILAEVVQHELAHQWFGNLVTMEFWDGLWLNEGFATWAAMHANDAFFPEWNVRQEFLLNDYCQALDLDGLRSSHPVEARVRNADEIGELFDAISYSKGGAVLRMLAAYLGEDVFLKGVKRYLDDHKYGNTTTEELWEALESTSGIEVGSMMSIWTKQIGYPVVEVWADRRGYVSMRQKRFLRTGDVSPEDDQIVYPIPMVIEDKRGSLTQILMAEREVTTDMTFETLRKINYKHTGLFRTHYSPDHLRWLGQENHRLSVEDRVGVISDAAALAAAGCSSSYDLLSLLLNFQAETDLVVWKQILATLDSLQLTWLFEPSGVRTKLQAFGRRLVAPAAHRTASSLDDHGIAVADRELSALLFRAAALLGDSRARSHASKLFQALKRKEIPSIDPNIRAAVYESILSDPENVSVAEDYAFIQHLFLNAKAQDERSDTLTALGRTSDLKLISRTLDLLLTDSVKIEEVRMPLPNVVSSAQGVVAAWRWLRDNYDHIRAKLDSGIGFSMRRPVQSCVSNLNSERDVEEIQRFFRRKETRGLEKSLEQACDEVRVKAKWMASGKADVERWLCDHAELL